MELDEGTRIRLGITRKGQQDSRYETQQGTSMRRVVEVLASYGLEPGEEIVKAMVPHVVWLKRKAEWEAEHDEPFPDPEPAGSELSQRELVELWLKINKYVEPELKAVEHKGEINGELTIKWAGENS